VPNDEMRRTWSAGADAWVQNEAFLDELFVPVTDAIVDAAAFRTGQSVLDLGCGTGTLLAAGATAGADVTGVDISVDMVAAAGRRVPAARVVAGDVQTADLRALPGAPFDQVVSRFGVMFFDDPVAAFANVRAASAPTARMAFACWRRVEENPMFTLGVAPLAERMGAAQAPAEPGASGPMAFQDPGLVTGVLTAAGWRGVWFEPVDFTCDYGPDGVELRLAVLLATAFGIRARAELESRLGPAGWQAVLDEMRAEVRQWQGDAPTLAHPAAVWLVRAAA
jgi:SAM-dependent methyltransferase